MTWGDEPPPPAPRTDYPVLALIDRAPGAAGPGFARAADAARLERLAREAADEYRGETVWLTGRVPAAALRVVCELLERERAAAPEAA